MDISAVLGALSNDTLDDVQSDLENAISEGKSELQPELDAVKAVVAERENSEQG